MTAATRLAAYMQALAERGYFRVPSWWLIREKSYIHKISRYFKGYPNGDLITIHHLLSHTSGIASYTNDSNYWFRMTPTAKPGTSFSYI